MLWDFIKQKYFTKVRICERFSLKKLYYLTKNIDIKKNIRTIFNLSGPNISSIFY